MMLPGLEIRAPLESESDALCRFEFGDRANDWGHRITESHYDWSTSRVALLDGNIISHVAIYDARMRIGACTARSGGVNLVYTVKEHRGKGVMRAVMESCLSAMWDNGYDTSVIVNGIRDFYTKFGYVFTWPRSNYFVQTEQMPAEAPTLTHRHFDRVVHTDRHAELNNLEYDGITGTVVRPAFLAGAKSPGEGYELLDTEGNVRAFCHTRPKNDTLYVDEYAGEPEQTLRLLGKLARDHVVKQVQFHHLPDRSRMARLLSRTHSQCIQEFSDSACFTSKIINLRSTLTRISDELSIRLQRTAFHAWSGLLKITCEDQTVCLEISNGTVQTEATAKNTDHTLSGDQHITQLLFGMDHPEHVIDDTEIQCTGQGRDLALALFTAQSPLMLNQSS